MTDADASGPSPDSAREQGSVLANLPRTRPQRSSARRAAARGAGSSNGRPPAGTSGAKGAAKPARKQTRTKAPATKRRPTTGAAKAAARKPSTSGPAAVTNSAASTEAKAASGSSLRPSSTVRAGRARAAKRPTPPPRPFVSEEPAPRQGFECESERTDGPVHPPGGAELVASAAEIVGELAKAGLSAGERLFRDVFSRLPGN